MALAQRVTVPHSRPTLADSVVLGPGDTTAWVMLVFESAQQRNAAPRTAPPITVSLFAVTVDGTRHAILARPATSDERSYEFARAVKVIRYMKELKPVMYVVEFHDPDAPTNPVDVFSALLPSACTA